MDPVQNLQTKLAMVLLLWQRLIFLCSYGFPIKLIKEMRIIFLNPFLEHSIIWSNFSQVCDEAKLKEPIYSKEEIHVCTSLEPEQHISEQRSKYLRKDHWDTWSTFKQSKYLFKITIEKVVGWLLSGSPFLLCWGFQDLLKLCFQSFETFGKGSFIVEAVSRIYFKRATKQRIKYRKPWHKVFRFGSAEGEKQHFHNSSHKTF